MGAALVAPDFYFGVAVPEVHGVAVAEEADVAGAGIGGVEGLEREARAA
jgi:hypothetical protein